MVTKKFLSLLTALVLVFSLVGCTKQEKKDADINDLLANTYFLKDIKEEKISNDKEITYLKNLKENNRLYKDIVTKDSDSKKSNFNPLFFGDDNFTFAKDNYSKKIIESKVYDLLKFDITIIYNPNDKNIFLAYLTKYINPKLDVVYDDSILVKNNNDKFDVFGKIIFKDTNLSKEDKDFFKYYKEKYPNVVNVEDNFITIIFNK